MTVAVYFIRNYLISSLYFTNFPLNEQLSWLGACVETAMNQCVILDNLYTPVALSNSNICVLRGITQFMGPTVLRKKRKITQHAHSEFD